jgi:GxxExxY protein
MVNPVPIPVEVEQIATKIVDAAFTVHKTLGPGLLESIYQPCFCHELNKRSLKFREQIVVPIVYDGLKFAEGFRLDVLVEDVIICELKAVETLLSVHEAQLMTYMKLTQRRLGFLINFNVPLIKRGIKRIVL